MQSNRCDEGSLAGAARKLGRSAAAVSRAVAFLEGHVGVQLLHRTTRLLKLREAGERYAGALLSGRPACTRRPVADFAEVGRARPVAGSYRRAARSAFRSEGSRLRRLRRAAVAVQFARLAGDAGS
jgi:hypothetical protein